MSGSGETSAVSSAMPNRYWTYPGWPVVAIAALMMVATLPGRTHGLGLVTEFILKDFGISQSWYASLNLVATLIGGLACLPIGGWLDRFGTRRVIPFILIGLSLSVLGIGWTSSLVVLAIAVTATRAFGQSMLSVASLALVAKWFGRRLPPAMGVYSLAMGVGFMFAFPSLGAGIVEFGWRPAWSACGWILLGLALILPWIIRNQPQDLSIEFPTKTPSAVASEVGGFTLSWALRTGSFWSVALGVSLYGASSSGLGLFQQGLLAERGFDVATYHQTLAVGAGLGVITNLIAGWALAGPRLHWGLVIALAIQAITLFGFRFVETLSHLYLYVTLMAVSGGMLTVVFFTVWGFAFGPKHVGKIQGAAQWATVIFSALGPLAVAELHRQFGTYISATNGFALASAIAALAAAFVPIARWSDCKSIGSFSPARSPEDVNLDS